MGLASRVAVCFLAAGTLVPQIDAAQAQEPTRAFGGDVFYSADSDDSEVLRMAIEFDLRNVGPEKRLGVRLEKAWYNPQGSAAGRRNRIFLQAADVAGGWTWNGRIGTDGDTIIGAASVHDDAKYRKEFFAERDIVETRQGLDQGIYSTFVGAGIDVPLNERNVFTAMAGVQEFTGENERVHLRGNYIHVLKPEIGLSVQLRGRYFHSTHPREFDYYSPRWYAQVLPAVQLRRFISGWQLFGIAGVGLQRDSDSTWRRSDYAQFRFRSPQKSRWSTFGELTYSSSPSDTSSPSSSYRYFQSSFGVARRF
jgi:hypothetical protein